MSPVLSGSDRIGSMVLAAASIELLPGRVADAGLPASPIAHVRREWIIREGESVFPEFDVLMPVEAPLRFNACCYKNVDLYRRAEWLSHPNGARQLSAVLAVAPDPRALLFFETILGIPPRALPEGGLSFFDGHVRLDILSASAAAARLGLDRCSSDRPRYLGYEIAVADLRGLRDRFDRERVPYRLAEQRICVDPGIGLGNYIVFTQSDRE
jgi:hypothetical protein